MDLPPLQKSVETQEVYSVQTWGSAEINTTEITQDLGDYKPDKNNVTCAQVHPCVFGCSM